MIAGHREKIRSSKGQYDVNQKIILIRKTIKKNVGLTANAKNILKDYFGKVVYQWSDILRQQFTGMLNHNREGKWTWNLCGNFDNLPFKFLTIYSPCSILAQAIFTTKHLLKHYWDYAQLRGHLKENCPSLHFFFKCKDPI